MPLTVPTTVSAAAFSATLVALRESDVGVPIGLASTRWRDEYVISPPVSVMSTTDVGLLLKGAFDGRGQCVYQRLDFRQQCGIVERNLNIDPALADVRTPIRWPPTQTSPFVTRPLGR